MRAESARPKIALVTALDLQEVQQWSWFGTITHMIRALETHCGAVTCIGPVHCAEQWIARARSKASRVLLKRDYHTYHSFLLARKYGQVFAERLRTQSFDVVVAPGAATEIAFLETEVPIILVEDATYGQLLDYYPDFSHLLKRSRDELLTLERCALSRASAVLSWSDWAARSAIEDFGADQRKVHVAPVGANIAEPPSREAALARTKSDRCRLLFIGLDWQRKGGEIAFETLLALRELGIAAELVIVGCVPPKTHVHEAMTVHPFLDKTDPIQRRQLEHLYATADFFLLPTRNEAFGLVFCEASAYGLPSVTTACGGVPYAVRDGENGFVLPYTADGKAYADVIARVYRDDERYYELVRSTRAAFETRLNWDVWGQMACGVISDLLAGETHAHRSNSPPSR